MRRSLIVVSLSLICAAAIVACGANAQTQSSAPVEQPSGSSSGPVIEKQRVKSYSLPPEKYEKAVAYLENAVQTALCRRCLLTVLAVDHPVAANCAGIARLG